MMTLKERADVIMKLLVEAGGTPYIVGGYVRDTYLRLPSKDIDIECFGLSFETMLTTLSEYSVTLQGKSFAVLIVTSPEGHTYDVSLPRQEIKQGVGHTNFKIIPDPNLTLEQAVMRRDLTINALYMDIKGNIIDVVDGLEDLKNGILRPVGPKFPEDPLRLYRAARFHAVLGFTISPDLMAYCRQLVPEIEHLPAERLLGEFEKMFTKVGSVPSRGIRALIQMGAISPTRMSEVFNLQGIPQDPKWHPEGDAFVHTMDVLDHAIRIAEENELSAEDTFILVTSALCHDFGKVTNTFFQRERWRSPAHDVAGVEPTESFLLQLAIKGEKNTRVRKIVGLVRYHMIHTSYQEVNKSNVRRLVRRLHEVDLTIKELSLLCLADALGSGGSTMPKTVVDILEQSKDITLDEAIKPFVQGRYFIKQGIPQGPVIGQLVAKCMELQMGGIITSLETGIPYADKFIEELKN